MTMCLMTMYQECHRYYGSLTRETTMARKLLERHGKPTPQTVKELRNETDMPMAECARMLRCMWRDMQLEQLKAENAKLRELATAFADCRNTTCDDCIRWDYPNGGCSLDKVLCELGMEVNNE